MTTLLTNSNNFYCKKSLCRLEDQGFSPFFLDSRSFCPFCEGDWFLSSCSFVLGLSSSRTSKGVSRDQWVFFWWVLGKHIFFFFQLHNSVLPFNRSYPLSLPSMEDLSSDWSKFSLSERETQALLFHEPRSPVRSLQQQSSLLLDSQ